MVLLVSHNCNGLRNIVNCKKYFSIANERNIDILLLQETFWDIELVESIEQLYNGKILMSNGINRRQGVAILVSRKYCENVKLVHNDEHGRFIHIEFQYNDIVCNIVNIYAPNNVNERVEFFSFLQNYMLNFDNIIIGGDWNTTLSDLDRCTKTGHKVDNAFRKLEHLMNDSDLYDIWRFRNPNKRVFSRKMIYNGVLKQSRLDYFLVNRQLTVFIQNIFHYDTSLSDHSFVEMKINFENVEKGPGLWILNNSLLTNDEYIEKIKNTIEEAKKCPLYGTEFLIWWDNLKYKIKKFSQVFGKRIFKEKHSKFFSIQSRLQRISERIANGEIVDLAYYENLKMELSALEEERCKGAILRSKAYWATESDKCTKYFLQLEKHKQESNCIKELLNDNNESVCNTEDILDVEYKFYKKLYSSVEIDETVMNEFLENVDVKITEDDSIMCDEDISLQEIEFSLKKMSKNKSPGSDGLTVEFYCTFFSSLKDILLKLFQTVEEQLCMSRSMKCGIISLIYKNKGERKCLKNYRPISLLQVDYKILAKIMANRFKKVLSRIISIFQTCCIPGRDIADAIASIRDIIDIIESEGLEGYIVKMDQEKAFDKVSHTYLISVLKRYGFGERFIKWIEIFYTDIKSSIKCNGFLTKYFKISNGIRQGCPISALLYVLSAEPLQCAISKCIDIKGVVIPHVNIMSLIYQHADDTTLTLGDKNSICKTMDVFDRYGKASGSKVNKSKSEILCIGTAKISLAEQEHIGLKYCEDCVQVLGVYVGKNKNMCDELNWKDKVKKIKAITKLWQQRQLTLFGRATVVSTLLMSRLWYTIAVTSIPEWALDDIKKCCLDFLWGHASHLVKYRVLVGKKDEGGINYPDIYLKLLSFRLKFISRYFNEECTAMWKNTMKYFLRKIRGMNIDNYCFCMTLNKEDCKLLPKFYIEMIDAWQYVKSFIDVDMKSMDILQQPLFLNPDIKVQGKIAFWQHFIVAGITQIKDLCFEVIPGFLSFNAVKEMVLDMYDDVNVKQLQCQYRELIECIPEDWKKCIKHGVFDANRDKSPYFIVTFGDKGKDLINCKTKDFYEILISKVFIKPDVEQFWLEILNEQTLPFCNMWKSVHNYWKPPDCVQLDFKLMHNRIFTNVKLKRIGLMDTNICDSCQSDIEDLLHIFLDCQMLVSFHDYINQLLVKLLERCETDVIVTQGYRKLILLGMSGKFKSVNVVFVNFFLSIVRLCIMKKRQIVKRSTLNFNLITFFKYTMKNYVTYFHAYCKRTNKENVFEKYFIEHNPILKETDDILLFYL